MITGNDAVGKDKKGQIFQGNVYENGGDCIFGINGWWVDI